jgi:hypothetical protein
VVNDSTATFADDLAALVAKAEALVGRAAEIAVMRAKDGRQFGAATQEQLVKLGPTLKELAIAVDELAAGEVKAAAAKAAEREAERFEPRGTRVTGMVTRV